MYIICYGEIGKYLRSVLVSNRWNELVWVKIFFHVVLFKDLGCLPLLSGTNNSSSVFRIWGSFPTEFLFLQLKFRSSSFFNISEGRIRLKIWCLTKRWLSCNKEKTILLWGCWKEVGSCAEPRGTLIRANEGLVYI